MSKTYIVVENDGSIIGTSVDFQQALSMYQEELERNSLTESEDPDFDVRTRDDVEFMSEVDDVVFGCEIIDGTEVDYGLYLKVS